MRGYNNIMGWLLYTRLRAGPYMETGDITNRKGSKYTNATLKTNEVNISGDGHKERFHFPFSFDVHGFVELGPDVRGQHLETVFRHVNPAYLSRGVHATRNIHSVPPNIIEHLLSTDNTGGHGAIVEPNSHLEPKPREALVDGFQDLDQLLREVDEFHEMAHCAGLVEREIEARGSHVRATDGLDLLHTGELGLVQEGIELADDLVQQSQGIFTLLLLVEAAEVDNGGEDHANALVVSGELSRLSQLEGDVRWKDVEEEPLGLGLALSRGSPPCACLNPADEAEPHGDLVHPVHDGQEDQDEQEQDDGLWSQMSAIVVGEVGLWGVCGEHGEAGFRWDCFGDVRWREFLNTEVEMDYHHHYNGHHGTEAARNHFHDVADCHEVDAADENHDCDKERHLDVCQAILRLDAVALTLGNADVHKAHGIVDHKEGNNGPHVPVDDTQGPVAEHLWEPTWHV